MTRRHSSFKADQSGTIAIIIAIILPVLIYLIFLAVQFRSVSNQKTALQAAADEAALALVREQALLMTNSNALNGLAVSLVDSNLARVYLSEKRQTTSRQLSAREAGGQAGVLEVTVTQQPVAKLQTIFGWPEIPSISVTAQAQQIGGSNICVVALAPSSPRALLLRRAARLTANGCAVYSNSSHSQGLGATRFTRLTADSIFSGGGFIGGAGNFLPRPVVDYPPLQDPLISRDPPSFMGCDHNNLSINGGIVTLDPGVYCGGLRLLRGARVSLNPGTYVIKDGGLQVLHSSRMEGEDVGFYLTGDDSTIRFFHESFIRLSAPTDGEMAGLLFFEDRDKTTGFNHRISSDNARYLVGTIYMPNGSLTIDANEPIADQSEYTAIVVDQLELDGQPNLVINSNYDLTDVPVPDGIGPQSGVSRLLQ